MATTTSDENTDLGHEYPASRDDEELDVIRAQLDDEFSMTDTDATGTAVQPDIDIPLE